MQEGIYTGLTHCAARAHAHTLMHAHTHKRCMHEHMHVTSRKMFAQIVSTQTHLSHLSERLGLSALLKGTSTDFSPRRDWDSNQQPFGYRPNALNR
jgi:hypothetical protein